MNHREIELNGKTLLLESSVLTIEKYLLMCGRDVTEDWVAENEKDVKIAKVFAKYKIKDYIVDFDKLTPEKQIELNDEIKSIKQKSNMNFFRDVITAMIMAGEYPQERTKESVWRDIPPFPQSNEMLRKAFDELFSQIIDPDTKKKILKQAEMNLK